jgi:homoserine O-succinyltransferase
MDQIEKKLATRPRQSGDKGRQTIVVGLLNNMPDGALLATEEQFCSLLQDAAPSNIDLKVKFLSLPNLERGDFARAQMRDRYESAELLAQTHLDGLIVTGAEPRTAKLEEERYWDGLVRVVDWSEAEHIPTIWSCLAAHAAVQRVSGVTRKRLPAKHSGVFSLRIAGGHRLSLDAPAEATAPHDLDVHQLEDAGYEIIAQSPDVGVDTFVRRGSAFTIFFQGHPEYDAGALGREYLRDVSRFLRGHQTAHPVEPEGYFDSETVSVLRALSARAQSALGTRPLRRYASAVGSRAPRAPWRPWALHIYGAWLHHLSITEPRRAVRAAARD